MNKKLLGCGVKEHDIDCLCDVILTSKEPMKVGVSIPHSYWCGDAIVEHYDLGIPWTSADLATFFEGLALVGKHINRLGQITVPNPDRIWKGRPVKKLTEEQLNDLETWVSEGMMPTPAVKLMMEKHGVEIHKSYVTKTKTRMKKRGQIQ